MKRRLPDRSTVSSRQTAMLIGWTQKDAARRHPVRYWRHHLAHDYDVHTICRMRRYLAKIDLPAEKGWRDAATGNAAAAIAIAFGMQEAQTDRLAFDAAMTALAICAFAGSDAARMVMAKSLRLLPGGGEAEVRIADSWLDLEASHG
ncbi:hypothetical protein [Bradyrhizobium diazoefficiens]|uniref:hypothetical protein n=1 Tax=Bradyrhizobium diazoefficiens TaxID=1355477 RepID=UPI00271525FB|nr:hypothetical protein [Bradyrhizobium diazoefficiens]WLB37989.1 hypothetical protein QIH78_42760 [Bradyrhizobium diazoefficiens]WLC17126.1 hypothetical protein QIH76_01525 [Bradyrhizobium diazoefficiens]